METSEAEEFSRQMVTAVAHENEKAIKAVLESMVTPMLQRLEMIGQAQVVLATGLRTVRRDRNATEIAKVLVNHFLEKEGALPPEIIHMIADKAYTIANEMETHALVAEAQAAPHKERVDQYVESSPKADPAVLARAFMGKPAQ